MPASPCSWASGSSIRSTGVDALATLPRRRRRRPVARPAAATVRCSRSTPSCSASTWPSGSSTCTQVTPIADHLDPITPTTTGPTVPTGPIEPDGHDRDHRPDDDRADRTRRRRRPTGPTGPTTTTPGSADPASPSGSADPDSAGWPGSACCGRRRQQPDVGFPPHHRGQLADPRRRGGRAGHQRAWSSPSWHGAGARRLDDDLIGRRTPSPGSRLPASARGRSRSPLPRTTTTNRIHDAQDRTEMDDDGKKHRIELVLPTVRSGRGTARGAGGGGPAAALGSRRRDGRGRPARTRGPNPLPRRRSPVGSRWSRSPSWPSAPSRPACG